MFFQRPVCGIADIASGWLFLKPAGFRSGIVSVTEWAVLAIKFERPRSSKKGPKIWQASKYRLALPSQWWLAAPGSRGTTRKAGRPQWLEREYQLNLATRVQEWNLTNAKYDPIIDLDQSRRNPNKLYISEFPPPSKDIEFLRGFRICFGDWSISCLKRVYKRILAG